jgi:hypothetical protein
VPITLANAFGSRTCVLCEAAEQQQQRTLRSKNEKLSAANRRM